MNLKNNPTHGVIFKSPINWIEVFTSPITPTNHICKGSKKSYRINSTVNVSVPGNFRDTRKSLYIDRNGIYIRDSFYTREGYNDRVYISVPEVYREHIKQKIKDYFKDAV